MGQTSIVVLFFCACVSFCAQAQEDTLATQRLDEVVIRSSRISGKITRIPAVQGVNVWTGKKSEVVNVADLDANIAEKTSRQVFAKVPGTFVYGLVDINASYSLMNNLVFKLNINNVANTQYFTKRPQFYPGPGVWSSDGRSITASVGIRI